VKKIIKSLRGFGSTEKYVTNNWIRARLLLMGGIDVSSRVIMILPVRR
jgi:hypothetical protein